MRVVDILEGYREPQLLGSGTRDIWNGLMRAAPKGDLVGADGFEPLFREHMMVCDKLRWHNKNDNSYPRWIGVLFIL